VDRAKSSFAKILGKWIIWLSQIILSMRKLTILSERAFAVLQPVFAELSFVLLLECVELSLISIEVVIV
jgi:hypothetical protein